MSAERCGRCGAAATHGIRLTVALRRHVRIPRATRASSSSVISYSCSGACLEVARRMAAAREGVRDGAWHYHYEVLELEQLRLQKAAAE